MKFFLILACILAVAFAPKPTTSPPPTTAAPTVPPSPAPPVPGDYSLRNGYIPPGLNDPLYSPGDIGSASFGTKFFVNTTGGKVTALKYFSPPGNFGSKTGRLWDEDCNVLGTVTFPATGGSYPYGEWLSVDLATPVTLNPYKIYIVDFVGGDKYYGNENGLYYGILSPPHLQAWPDSSSTKTSCMNTGGNCPIYWSNVDTLNDINFHID